MIIFASIVLATFRTVIIVYEQHCGIQQASAWSHSRHHLLDYQLTPYHCMRILMAIFHVLCGRKELNTQQSFACLYHKSVSHFSSASFMLLIFIFLLHHLFFIALSLLKYKAIKLNSRHFKTLKGNSYNPLEGKLGI